MISNLRACGLPDVCFSYIVRQFLVPAAGGLHKKIPRACLVVTKNYDVLDFARFFATFVMSGMLHSRSSISQKTC